MEQGLHGQESGLKYSQKNIFVTSLRHVDRLLADIEDILDCEASNCLFPRFRSDLSKPDRDEMQAALNQLRRRMLASMQRMGIDVPAAETSASHAIETNLDFIDIDIEELRPRYMKAYGKVSAETADDLNSVLDELQQEARRFRRLLDNRSAPR